MLANRRWLPEAVPECLFGYRQTLASCSCHLLSDFVTCRGIKIQVRAVEPTDASVLWKPPGGRRSPPSPSRGLVRHSSSAVRNVGVAKAKGRLEKAEKLSGWIGGVVIFRLVCHQFEECGYASFAEHFALRLTDGTGVDRELKDQLKTRLQFPQPRRQPAVTSACVVLMAEFLRSQSKPLLEGIVPSYRPNQKCPHGRTSRHPVRAQQFTSPGFTSRIRSRARMLRPLGTSSPVANTNARGG